jgi:hypothetical protein
MGGGDRRRSWTARFTSGRLNAVLPLAALIAVVPFLVLALPTLDAASASGAAALLAIGVLVVSLVVWLAIVAVEVRLLPDGHMAWRPLLAGWRHVSLTAVEAIERGEGTVGWFYPGWGRIWMRDGARVRILDADSDAFDGLVESLAQQVPDLRLKIAPARPAYRRMSSASFESRS